MTIRNSFFSDTEILFLQYWYIFCLVNGSKWFPWIQIRISILIHVIVLFTFVHFYIHTVLDCLLRTHTYLVQKLFYEWRQSNSVLSVVLEILHYALSIINFVDDFTDFILLGMLSLFRHYLFRILLIFHKVPPPFLPTTFAP